jgi:hypothetical protein
VIVYYETGNEFILGSSGQAQHTYASWTIARHRHEIVLETAFDTSHNVKMSYRVAVNCCIALAHFKSVTCPMYPVEAESDMRLSKEDTERGRKARDRVGNMPVRISFDQSVVLSESAESHRSGKHTGREVSSHWRRGHWCMQPCGPRNSQRRLLFRRPVLVRSDLFVGDTTDTTVSYSIDGG